MSENEKALRKAGEGYRVPRIAHDSDERIEIKISSEDQKKTRRRGMIGMEEQAEKGVPIITDLLTGKKYRYELAACSLPTCFCDAVVTEVKLEVVK